MSTCEIIVRQKEYSNNRKSNENFNWLVVFQNSSLLDGDILDCIHVNPYDRIVPA